MKINIGKHQVTVIEHHELLDVLQVTGAELKIRMLS
jgi:hypothetical protein